MSGLEATDSPVRDRLDWNSFWFAPRSAMALAVIRFGCGLLVLFYLLSMGTQAVSWLHPAQSIVPTETVSQLLERSWAQISLFDYLPSATGVQLLHVLAMASALAMAVGLGTRITTTLTWLFFLSYLHRIPFANSLVEPVLAMLLAYLVIEPGGRAWSLDRWWRIRRGHEAPDEASWTATVATRLMQLHLSALVLMIGTNRLAGEPWWSGMGVWWLIALPESRLVNLTGLANLPQFYLVNLWTHLVVALELSAVVLLWLPRSRLATVAALTLVWGSLALLTGQIAWWFAMTLALLAFLPPQRLGART